MKTLRGALFLVVLATLPLLAADPFYGTWKMRPSGLPGDTMTQVLTMEPAGDGVKVTAVIDWGTGTKGTLTYTIKFDGVEVPVYSDGKVMMKMRAKRIGPNVYEGSTTAGAGTSTFRTTISADGKVMTSESTTGQIKSHSVFDRVK